jgi:hypothetical protein
MGMNQNTTEQRKCIRFTIPGSSLNVTIRKPASEQKLYDEEFCPVADISRGGIRFLCNKSVPLDSQVDLKISIPGEQIPLRLCGVVRWIGTSAGKNYAYQMGIQFFTYGEGQNQNYPGALVKIIALEQKFAPPEDLKKYVT